MKWRENEIPANRCLTCDEPLDAATSVDHNRAPTAGSVSVCMYCGSVMVFTHDLRFRKPTLAEHMSFEVDPQIARVRLAITHVQKRHRQ